MFTGLIESVGSIEAIAPSAAGSRLRITADIASALAPGDSVAVNGVCLTVVSSAGSAVAADVSPETLRVTTLGGLQPGSLVNLERSLRADARIGGHFVQGHVDGTGVVDELRPEGDSYWLAVRYPASMASYLVHKGSIAVDGISLTIARLADGQFGIQIVPFTRERTNLRRAQAGDSVNLECDILGKYVVRALELQREARRV